MQRTERLAAQDHPPRGPLGPQGHRELLAVAGVAAVVVVVTVMSALLLPVRAGSPDLLPGRPWWEGWVNWDSGWYRGIALHGYSYVLGQQGPVAFFPLYPLLMRLGSGVVGSVTGPGIVVTLASGVAAALLLARWFRERLSPEAAWTALLLFLLYPYAFYLFGPVYADATFLVAVVGSFMALERGHPWLAGLIGVAATAARPLGAVLVVGLVVRTLERRGVVDGGADAGWRRRLGRLRPADGGVLLAAAGVGGYAFYLWHRFGDPLAFLTVQEAWGQQQDAATWFKFDFFRETARFDSPNAVILLAAHAVVTVIALALLPRVVKRFGWGYGIYAILIVGVPALSTKNFFGMGRYLLLAFPCFAVAAELLAGRARLRAWTLTGSGLAMVAAASYSARAYYVS
ncbi:MAG: mannosyltransferase family protein [Acidimicrobiales bacterium]